MTWSAFDRKGGTVESKHGLCVTGIASALVVFGLSLEVSTGSASGTARKWYDRAIEWMKEKNKSQDAEFRLFRAEAEELMKKESDVRNQDSEKNATPN